MIIDALERPTRAADVRLHPPADGNGPWVLQHRDQRFIRIGSDAAHLLLLLDGSRTCSELTLSLGAPWTSAEVHSTVDEFRKMGLLQGSERRRDSNSETRRISYTPPLSLHITLVNPARLLEFLRPLTQSVAGLVGRVAAVVLALSGLIILAAHISDVSDTLSRPLPLSSYLIFLVATFCTTVLHELGHGIVLAHYGGKSRRMGIMLLCMIPAFFCDVSDGWRLPQRRQRVWTALAGVAVQAAVAGVAAVMGLLLPVTNEVRELALAFSVVTYILALLNLIPFVKFDGYIALMSILDISHLRAKSMADARNFISSILFGGRRYSELPNRYWVVPYGVLCTVFPFLLIAFTLSIWADVALSTGLGGAIILFCVGIYGVYRACKGVVSTIKRARATGAKPPRIIVSIMFITTAFFAAIICVKVPYAVQAAYVRHGSAIEILIPKDADSSSLREGMPISLRSIGILGSSEVARARLDSALGEPSFIPAQALTPVQDDLGKISAVAYPATGQVSRIPVVGAADLHVGKLPLITWAIKSYGSPILHTLMTPFRGS